MNCMLQKTYFFNADEEPGKDVIAVVHVGVGEILDLKRRGFNSVNLSSEPEPSYGQTIYRAPDLKLACGLYKKTVEMVDEAYKAYIALCDQEDTIKKCIVSELYDREEFDANEAVYVEGLIVRDFGGYATIEIIKTIKP